jgi:hypothetical protein
VPEVKLTPIERSRGNYKEISGSGFEFEANKEASWKLRGDDLVTDDDIINPEGLD